VSSRSSAASTVVHQRPELQGWTGIGFESGMDDRRNVCQFSRRVGASASRLPRRARVSRPRTQSALRVSACSFPVAGRYQVTLEASEKGDRTLGCALKTSTFARFGHKKGVWNPHPPMQDTWRSRKPKVPDTFFVPLMNDMPITPQPQAGPDSLTRRWSNCPKGTGLLDAP